MLKLNFECYTHISKVP